MMKRLLEKIKELHEKFQLWMLRNFTFGPQAFDELFKEEEEPVVCLSALETMNGGGRTYTFKVGFAEHREDEKEILEDFSRELKEHKNFLVAINNVGFCHSIQYFEYMETKNKVEDEKNGAETENVTVIVILHSKALTPQRPLK